MDFRDSLNRGVEANPVRAIAMYLPQYHPIPENDEWWGKGFTEWTNVTAAKPLFKGHYQPHLPADLGFYDLRLPEIRQAQADLARAYGIHGFCYYHYWFNGRRVLERPFEEVLSSKQPDFPFCLCWANENWTRTWDGMHKNVLLAQDYGSEDDRNHINYLVKAFRDERYIRINGKPLFLVYRTELLPNPKQTAEIWREGAAKAGIGDIYLVSIERFQENQSPQSIGFDAAAEFAPDAALSNNPLNRRERHRYLSKVGAVPKYYLEQLIYDYDIMMQKMLDKPRPEYKRFLASFPSWDNSARRKRDATIFRGSSPEKYQRWLEINVHRTMERLEGEERITFINAWNEWGEGCHLEPDRKYGHAFLEATRAALKSAQ